MLGSCQCLTYTLILSLFLSSSVFLYYLYFIPQGLITTFFFPTWLTIPGFSNLFSDYSISILIHSIIYVPQETLYYICYCVGWNIHYSCPCFLLRVVFVSRKISPKIWTTFIYYPDALWISDPLTCFRCNPS